jgi:hypothetical protein
MPSEDDERQSRGVVKAARLDPTLAVERQLLAEEEILGGQARVRAHAEREPLQEITDQSKDNARHHRMADNTAPDPQRVRNSPAAPPGRSGQIVPARNFLRSTTGKRY